MDMRLNKEARKFSNKRLRKGGVKGDFSPIILNKSKEGIYV